MTNRLVRKLVQDQYSNIIPVVSCFGVISGNFTDVSILLQIQIRENCPTMARHWGTEILRQDEHLNTDSRSQMCHQGVTLCNFYNSNVSDNSSDVRSLSKEKIRLWLNKQQKH